MNLEKCKFCAYAMFDTHIVGWTCKDGKSVELREQDDYPTSCSFGIDGARPIDNYCSKEYENKNGSKSDLKTFTNKSNTKKI